MSWRRWHWLDDLLLPLGIAAIRLCWLGPWLDLLRRWLTPAHSRAALPAWAILALQLGALALTRSSLRRHNDLRRARILAATGGLGALLLLLWWLYGRPSYPLWAPGWLLAVGRSLAYWGEQMPPALLTTLVAAYLWLRGILDGRDRLTHDQVWGAFAVGFGAQALLLLLTRIDPAGLPAGTEQWMLAFFAVGLSTLALSSLQLARARRRDGEPETPALSRYWLVSVATVILALLAVGLLISAIVTPEAVSRMLGWSAIVLRLLSVVLYYIIYAISFVVFLVLTPLINWLQSLLAQGAPQEPMELPEFQRQLEEFAPTSPAAIPPTIDATMRWLAVGALFIAVGLIFALALRRLWAPREEEIDESREIILSRDLLAEQLADLWRSWLDRFRRSASAAVSPYLPMDDVGSARRAIRQIYRALLEAAKARGIARQRWQTPLQYEATLAQRFPGVREELDSITRAYLSARYDAIEPPDDVADAVRQAWESTRRIIEGEDGDGKTE